MKTYLAIFFVAAFSSITFTPLLRRLCERFGLLDEVTDARRVHRKPVPRLGGVAIYFSILFALSLLLLIHNDLTTALRSIRWKFPAILIPSTLVFLFGVYDDLRGTKAPAKFVVQGLAGVLLYAMGGRIEVLSIPFVGPVELPYAVGFALTVIWVVGISNAFNLIDGIDGLAAGAALFASVVMVTVALMTFNPFVSVVAIAMTGALVGFLRYNFNPASIFLGDSGALFLGFLLAALSVQGTQKASTVVAVTIPLLAFGVPIVDMSVAMARRFLSGRPVFQGDREHIHHKLLERGWSQRRVALALYGVCALFGLLAMLLVVESGRTTGFILFVVGVALIFGLSHLRYHEVDELRASVQRNIGERRVRAAHNLRVRRACRALAEVKTLDEVFKTVERMLEIGEFDYVTARICFEDELTGETPGPSASDNDTAHKAITWSWGLGGVMSPARIDSLKEFWTLHLPLTTTRGCWGYITFYRELERSAIQLDVNYMVQIFRREISAAIERALTETAQPEQNEKVISVSKETH
jgi:UDP-GlcNAc:undecaprenyl-phosphate GlcNAc-1-phosphate transferase